VKKGIFVFGNYGWLGEYRAAVIKAALEKHVGREVRVKPLVPLDIFHAAYLFLTDRVENPDPVLAEITKPIVENAELRSYTAGRDLVSRAFAVKFLAEFLKKLEEEAEKRGIPGDRSVEQALSGGAGGDRGFLEAVSAAAERAAEKAKEDARKMALFHGLAAGVGHSVVLDEMLNLDFAVDPAALLRLFREIEVPFSKHRFTSPFGERGGYRLGRDLARLAPSAAALPDDLFWYRFATSTLPLVDTEASRLDDFVMVVDKSGSMSGDKTLWSRAVALALMKAAVEGRVRAKLIFFDDTPMEPIDLRAERKRALETILRLRCSGGTSIDRALEAADGLARTIVLITDGEDSVSYKPSSRLISVMILGDNPALREVSDRYLSVEPTKGGALRVLEVVG